MKCVKNIKTGDISRIKDDIAKSKVKSGTHTYAKKSEWKLLVRAPKETTEGSN